MKFSHYLASKSIALCITVIVLILWFVFACLAGVSFPVIAITVAVVLTSTAGWLVCEYILICKRLKKLNRLCTEIEQGYLLGEVFPKPVNAHEEEYFRVMKFVSRSAIALTEQVRRDKEEYCEYVEKWIHEIKTPLTACTLIAENGGDMRKLKTELKRAENLTENVLYCARLRTIEADTQISQISVQSVIDKAVKSQMELLLQAGISVETDGEFTAYTDGKSLEFILKQFLVNCAKYCPECRIKIIADNGVIAFEDNGTGIPSHELPRIFARGFVGNIGRVRGGGTGMGLYLVHELCAQLGIAINVQSEEGKYTRFTLEFPN